MKYNLGCGSQYMQGYCNVDFPQENHNVNHDIKADLYIDILDMKYESCIEIRSHHFFEHFNYFNTFALLYKWTKALELNGKLVIDIPDLEALCQAYLNANNVTKFVVTRYLFGSHEANWAYHINGWSKDTISFVLLKLGYDIDSVNKYGDINSDKPNCGLTVVAIKKSEHSNEKLIFELNSILELYKNGNTDFENSLHQYFVKEMANKI